MVAVVVVISVSSSSSSSWLLLAPFRCRCLTSLSASFLSPLVDCYCCLSTLLIEAKVQVVRTDAINDIKQHQLPSSVATQTKRIVVCCMCAHMKLYNLFFMKLVSFMKVDREESLTQKGGGWDIVETKLNVKVPVDQSRESSWRIFWVHKNGP